MIAAVKRSAKRAPSSAFLWVVASIPLATLCVLLGVLGTGDVNW